MLQRLLAEKSFGEVPALQEFLLGLLGPAGNRKFSSIGCGGGACVAAALVAGRQRRRAEHYARGQQNLHGFVPRHWKSLLRICGCDLRNRERSRPDKTLDVGGG